MDNGILIKDMAKLLGVAEDTVINWERTGVRPCKKYHQKIRDFVFGAARFLCA
jgi:DNA-binding XRE family transcriptional regulator